MQPYLRASFLALLAILPACGPHHSPVHVVPASEVSLLVVATDAHGYAIEGIHVEILSVWHEWSEYRVEPDPYYAELWTDAYGEAWFSPSRLALMQAGFLEDGYGKAVLSADPFEDEASIRVRVGTPGLGYTTVDVDVDEWQSAGYLEVRF